jgi:hypothetical protein
MMRKCFFAIQEFTGNKLTLLSKSFVPAFILCAIFLWPACVQVNKQDGDGGTQINVMSTNHSKSDTTITETKTDTAHIKTDTTSSNIKTKSK